ncbi:MAG: hypothetical protein VYE73_06755 [Acidobacteriota bacterium]|nr:hypothetical protein [Acidobacteriota bacterium]
MSEARDPQSEGEAVADVLERVRAGARQRQAELASLDRDLGDLPASLAELRRQTDLEEPSLPREGSSALVHYLQKAIYHLFTARHHRSLLRQQTRFNRSVALSLEDLYRRQRRLRAALDETAAADPNQDGSG